ncbi:hypothetical protein BOQ62_22595, partial [Chryseobacterium sp. CH21]|uniref:hypothetical protein n=1 Tax=Chryseobacterium sp. CH21 TaxID=713556 RepID=UPI001027DD1A
QLHYDGIPDCNLYQHFVDGWYYYDKYQKKIPLTGLYDYGKLSSQVFKGEIAGVPVTLSASL